jgi:threonine dehydratase
VTAPALAPTLPDRAELEAAERLVRAVMPETPQYRWPLLEARTGTETWVKHEDATPAGAFKVRGGIVYFDWLARQAPRVPGVVTATRGNHGQSVGLAARAHGIPAVVVVPHGNSRAKNAAMRALGVELVEHGDDFQAAIERADAIAEERGWHRMPSFHRLLVAGRGHVRARAVPPRRRARRRVRPHRPRLRVPAACSPPAPPSARAPRWWAW